MIVHGRYQSGDPATSEALKLSTGFDHTHEKIKIWHLETGELLHTMDGHRRVDRTFAIGPDGETITSGSSQNTIELWHLKTGKLICSLPGHADAVESVAFSADGQFLVSGSRDKTIKVWRRSSKE